MDFHIAGLDPSAFTPLFECDDHALAARGILRRVVDANPGYPCRVSLQYAELGESVLLLPFEHLPTRSPYRSSGPIYVRRNVARFEATNTLPEVLRRARPLSVRAYDRQDLMVGSEVLAPAALKAGLAVLLEDERASYLHVHNAGPGCFSCRIDRAAVA